MPRTATIKLNDSEHYGKDAIAEGLKKQGWGINFNANVSPAAGDCIVVWNRHGSNDVLAKRWEVVGGFALIIENAWIYPGYQKQGHMFAICKHQHNGPGSWYVGKGDRWSQLSMPLSPWRQKGNHLLILPQRGIGPKGVAQPKNWEEDVIRRLRKITKRPIRVRAHPGKAKWGTHPLAELKGAHAAIVWASGAGIKAIAAGYPVFYELPNWIGAPAARYGIDDLENPYLGDRQEMFHRLAWAQWTQEEIREGLPFEHLDDIK